MSAPALSFATVWDTYRRFEPFLPPKPAPAAALRIAGVRAVSTEFDALILDAYGVLNLGHQAIPEALAAFAAIRASGLPFVVLTNDASGDAHAIAARHRTRGFDIAAEQIVGGMDLLPAMAAELGGLHGFGYLGPSPRPQPQWTTGLADLCDRDTPLDELAGFLLLEHEDWDQPLNQRLIESLARRARPVLLANPDVTAPHPDYFSVEPGYHAVAIAEAAGVRPALLGKPSPALYATALAALGDPSPARVLAVGDTLHTDILGARGAGLRALLVESGVCRGRDSVALADACGIWPDFVSATL